MSKTCPKKNSRSNWQVYESKTFLVCPNHTLDASAVFFQELECITLNHTGFRRLANTAVWMLPTGCLTPWTSLQWVDISQHLPFLGANYDNKEVSSVAVLVVAAFQVPPRLGEACRVVLCEAEEDLFDELFWQAAAPAVGAGWNPLAGSILWGCETRESIGCWCSFQLAQQHGWRVGTAAAPCCMVGNWKLGHNKSFSSKDVSWKGSR